MGATSDNYDIVTSGITYTIASDFVKPLGACAEAHHQIVKIAYGLNDTARYVSNTNPLPVGLCGPWTQYNFAAPSGFNGIATVIVGSTGMLSIEGGSSGAKPVGITVGSISVTGSSFDIRRLSGGFDGFTSGADVVGVQGISGAFPVGITLSGPLPVSISSFSNIGIFGVSGATAITVQATNFSIRGLSSASDTVTVYGGGTAATVSVGMFAFTGNTAAPLYAENNALNVNIKDTVGITVSATNLDIRDLNFTSDTVRVVGQGGNDNTGTATVPTYVNVATGVGGVINRVGGYTADGWCGAAMNVYVVNSGICFSVNATFSNTLGITAPSFAPIPITGTTFARNAVWVAGDTANGPVIVRGNSGGFLPVQDVNSDIQTSVLNNSVQQVKTNTDFLVAMKKALYAQEQGLGAFDFSDKNSIYTLVRDNIGTSINALSSTVSNSSVKVQVDSTKQQSSFRARTGFIGFTPRNLSFYNNSTGYTCGSGVRIKASRIATGASASSNQFMCIISAADAAIHGGTAGTASFVLYHGEEAFFDVDNINKIQVFYPAFSLGFAPNNTATGMTFSFYAS